MKKLMVWVVLCAWFASPFVGMVYAQDASQVQSQGTTWNCPRMGQGTAATADGWFCPWANSGMQGGRMHHGKGMGKGMGPQGMKNCPRQADCPYRHGKSVSQDEARGLVQDYLKAKGDANLKLGTLTDEKEYYEAQILGQDGSPVEKIQVNKQTGWFRTGSSKN
jgi:hypothetical protein